MRTIALDPGGTTGMCFYGTSLKLFEVRQITGAKHHIQLMDTLRWYEPKRVICERFDYISDQPNADLRAREYIGITELYCQENSIPLIMQKPSDAKVFWTVDKIKRLNLWQPGLPHGMDALRHMLTWITFTQKDPTFLQMLKRTTPA